MKNKTINLNSVFTSTRSGRIIAIIECGVFMGLLFFLVGLIVTSSRSISANSGLPSNKEVIAILSVIGVFIGSYFALADPVSLLLWKLFKPTESQISIWKEKEHRRLQCSVEENKEKIKKLQQKNYEIETQISTLLQF